MREILFKAKSENIDGTFDWVEGYLSKCDGKWTICDDEGCGCFIEENTICQYTGLTDKNANKIWENDIVKCYSFDCRGRESEFISDVFWDDCSWMLHEEEHCDGMLCYFDKNIKYESHVSEIEVIGNIFDNYELLNDSCTNSITGN